MNYKKVREKGEENKNYENEKEKKNSFTTVDIYKN